MSETEAGYGRSDLIIKDPARKRCLILELKHAEKVDKMESALKEASSQIVKMKYGSTLTYEGYGTILKYGMSFYDKKARVVSVRS